MFKKHKKLFIRPLIIMVLLLLWYYIQLPDFQETANGVEWKGRKYHFGNDYPPDRRWVLGKRIGENNPEFIMFALEGDKKKERHMVVIGTEYRQSLYIEKDYQIPEKGEITGVIVEYRLVPNSGYALSNVSYYNRFVKKKYLKEIVKEFQFEQKVRKFEEDIDVTENEFYAIHVCFNGSPVAGKRLGFVGEIEGRGIFLFDEDGFLNPDNTKSFKLYIQKGTEYFIVDSKSVMREIEKLKALYKHDK